MAKMKMKKNKNCKKPVAKKYGGNPKLRMKRGGKPKMRMKRGGRAR